MAVGGNGTTSRDYFADLQEGMVGVIALAGAMLGYGWLAANIWGAYLAGGGYMLSPAAAAWLGSAVLLACATLSYLWRRTRHRLATLTLAWGILAAVTCAVRAFPLPVSAAAYLFIVPILFAGALLSQRGFLLLAAAALALAVDASLARAGADAIWLPLAVLLTVTLATWLSTQRLFTALDWVWRGYQQARNNEEIARDRQAELQRTLKALDETTYRLERANYMLAWARDQAEEARRLKQQFAQTISHELRTPLNLIVGFTELMTESPEYYGAQLAPRYLRDLRIIHRNARHLQTLINDVLDLARIEAAQMTLVREEVDPAGLVSDAITGAASLIESQGLTLEVRVAAGLPPLRVDPTRIRQVLFNLLNNAARFTEKGGVTVSVAQQGEEVVFAVVDTGVGIAPDALGRIFEDFQQADNSTRRRHGGAGLGLAISKRFVTLHGGRIWVESQPGAGSTFSFSLPVGNGQMDAGEAGTVASARAGHSGTLSDQPVLLAVTHSLTAASLLARHIHGCNTVVVPDLAHAQSAAARLLPQAIVVDQAVCAGQAIEPQALAASWGLGPSPLMVCPLPGERSLAQQLDVNGYLVKPVTRQGLWDVLRQFGEKVDRILVVDDDEEFVQLMGRMLDNPVRRYQVSTAATGQEALAMMRRRRPDLVLLDVRLPDLSGPEIIRRMRERPEWRAIPIVMVSAQDEPETTADGLSHQPSALTIVRATAWQSAEVVRWIQEMVDATVAPPGDPANT
jgi:signal transduction histidine kinase/CheY-like chemotaxis protein